VVDVPRRQRLGKLNMTIPLTDPFTDLGRSASVHDPRQ